MSSKSAVPVMLSDRLAIVDILRGWALLGVVVMNYFNFASTPRVPGTLAAFVELSELYFFSTKGWALLSVLFGYGFGLLNKKLSENGVSFTPFYLKRMAFLFIFGLANTFFYFGDILHDYAVMGCIFLIFTHFKPKTLLWISGLIFLLSPITVGIMKEHLSIAHGAASSPAFWDAYMGNDFWEIVKQNFNDCYRGEVLDVDYSFSVHLQMLCMMLLGYAAMKAGILQNLQKSKPLLKRIFWCTLPLSALLLYLQWETMILRDFPYYNITYTCTTIIMLCQASALCLLYMSGRGKIIFKGMQLLGSMTLSHYLAQNLLGLLLFSGIGLGMANRYDLVVFTLLALAVYICQIFVSIWWHQRYYYGPVEWLWRCLTYGRLFKMRKTQG
jgi:uncharacterized protein